MKRRFKLVAKISSDGCAAIRPILRELVTKNKPSSMKENKANSEFELEVEMEGESAKDLNRALLSALRRAVKKTRLRAEWTSLNDNVAEKFFDYVPKGRKQK